MKKDKAKLKEIRNSYKQAKEDFKYGRIFEEKSDDIKDLEERFEQLINSD